MSGLIVQPQFVSTAAASVAQIGSTIDAATAAAARSTTGVLAAAGDEVSVSAATLFDGYAQDYQALLKRAGAFHQQFAAALAGAQSAYAEAEMGASNALGSIQAEAEALLFGPAPAPGAFADPPLPSLQGTTVGLIIGGSGLPIPPQSYVTSVLNYVNQNFSVLPANAQPLFTPEGLYPLTGVKSLPFNTSVTQGIAILENQINSQLTAAPTGSIAVLGYSQSAVISSLVMGQIASGHYPFPVPSPSQLGFTLLG
ncbi:MAG: PE domain-containing protein, partial [Mycobacterium sp.]